MNINNLYVAEVFNNLDPLLQGRVQVFIEPIMEDWIPLHYPWARLFSMGTGGSSDFGKGSVPEEGSKVWVFFEKPQIFRNPFYMADVQLSNLNPHIILESIRASSTGINMGFISIYPDIKFQILKNGVIFAMSSGPTPEIFMALPNGSYIILDSLGNIDIQNAIGSYLFLDSLGNIDIQNAIGSYLFLGSKGNVVLVNQVGSYLALDSEGNIELECLQKIIIKSNTGKLNLEAVGGTLFNMLNTLINALNSHTHPFAGVVGPGPAAGSLTSGVTNAPLPNFITNQTELGTILE